MGIDPASGGTRRHVLAAGAALGVGAAIGRVGSADARLAAQPIFFIIGGGGLAGGGTVPTERAEAQFSVFGSRLTSADDQAPSFFGQLRWLDPDVEGEALLIESTEIIAYGPIEGDKRARRMVGLASVNGEGSYPFVLEAVDAGGPGPADAADTVSLTVGAGADVGTPAAAPTDDFAYEVSATPLSSGDLQLVEFNREAAGA